MNRQVTFRFQSLIALSTLSLLAIGCGTSNGPSGVTSQRLNGGGSSFVYPLMSTWTGVYEKEKGVQINYQSIGSGGGIQKLIAKEFEFGCTDAPLNDEQLENARASGGEVVHIPLVMGGAVPIYNLDEVQESLRFTGPVLADIFLRRITRWNDERLKSINPKVADKLPAKDILAVHRSDGSGTTYMFSDYLAKVSPEWKQKAGVGTSLKWPEDTIGAKGSEGVAGQVKLNPGSIGYVELTYARQNKIRFGSVQNQEGEFVAADLESVTAGANNALTQIPEDLRFSLTNAPGKGSYPISSAVWAVIYVKQPAGKGQLIVDFLRWATREDEGQKHAKPLDYAPLPKGLIERVDKKLAQVKVGG